MKKLYEVRGLKKYYPVKRRELFQHPLELKAVDGIDVDIYSGETLGIVGESGCGKSTLGRLLIRLSEPTGGNIVFDGKDITGLSGTALKKQRRQMQIIFQDPYDSLNPRMTIRSTLSEPFKIQGCYNGKTKEKIFQLLDHVGLSPEHLDRYPHEFSGGQRQRIGIARALALNPRFIVADEPVASLDVSIQAQILKLLSTLRDSYHLTMAFIAHDLAVVQAISHRVAVMYLGRIVELAETKELFREPLHPYTKALMAAVPIPDPAHIYDEENMISGEIPSLLHPPTGCPFHPRCPYAEPRCREEKPDLRILDSGRAVACHLCC